MIDSTAKTAEAALEFPCRFPIKAMGKASDDFDSLIVEIVRRHAPDFSDTAIQTRHSSNGRYVSVTVTIQAKSRRQLDNIYLDLTAHDRVLVAL